MVKLCKIERGIEVHCRRLFDAFISGTFVYMVGRCCFMLELGSSLEKLFVALVLFIYIALSVFLLLREGERTEKIPLLIVMVSIAMLMRVLCFDYVSGDYHAFLSNWYAFFKNNGGFAAIAYSVGDYNVPYLYFMAAISYLEVPDLYLIKLFSVLFDVLLAWGGYRFAAMVKGRNTCIPLLIYCALLYLPTVVLNGSYWGQCDVIYGALCVHAITDLLSGNNKRSVILVAMAFSFKLQAIFVMPMWGVCWLARKIRFPELLLFPATYLVVITPALLLGKPFLETISIYLNQVSEYPALTSNAPSVYQLIPYGAEVNEGLLGGIGIGLAFLLVMLLLWIGLKMGRTIKRELLLAMLPVLSVGVPFLLPRMHERYFFLGDVLTVCCTCFNGRYAAVAGVVCSSSFLSYFVFLNCAFNKIVYRGEHLFVMLPEMDLMLMGFVCALVLFANEAILDKRI